MTPVGMNNYVANLKLTQPQEIPTPSIEKTQIVETKQVVLSEEGRALLDTLAEVDKAEKLVKEESKTVGDKVESFAYGALGMDHPDDMEVTTDGSYSAGQYFKGALAVGAILLAIV